jgi:monoamine oxidase
MDTSSGRRPQSGELAKSAAQGTDELAGTLYFAGEHTDTTGHWGTVHGAIRGGLRAARQVLLDAGIGDTANR